MKRNYRVLKKAGVFRKLPPILHARGGLESAFRNIIELARELESMPAQCVPDTTALNVEFKCAAQVDCS